MKKNIPVLDNLSDRLNYALLVTGTKKADLARTISVKPQIIQFLCNSKTQASKFTFEIATALGLNTQWLATGEGEIFVDDDPKQQFVNTYQLVPLLQGENINKVFLQQRSIDHLEIQTWLPLRVQEINYFAIEIADTSMEPIFPMGAYAYIKKCPDREIFKHKYVFLYLEKYDIFAVREFLSQDSRHILRPSNLELFKTLNVTSDMKLLGIVTDCFWHVK